MLYESTKSLLLSILRSLEAEEIRWDDQTESGNACLYEMHQMSGPLYKAYRSDTLNASSAGQSTLPEKLNRAIPHVRMMVIAIRHKDRTRALESGRVALAEMNGISAAASRAAGAELGIVSEETSSRQRERHNGKNGIVVEVRRASRPVQAASGK